MSNTCLAFCSCEKRSHKTKYRNTVTIVYSVMNINIHHVPKTFLTTTALTNILNIFFLYYDEKVSRYKADELLSMNDKSESVNMTVSWLKNRWSGVISAVTGTCHNFHLTFFQSLEVKFYSACDWYFQYYNNKVDFNMSFFLIGFLASFPKFKVVYLLGVYNDKCYYCCYLSVFLGSCEVLK